MAEMLQYCQFRAYWILLVAAGMFVLLQSTQAFAHCNSIVVTVDGNGRLTLNQGTPDPIGFAGRIYLDASPDCMLEPAPVDRLIVDIPGFEVQNMAVDSGLFLEPILRTGGDVGTPEERWFWFWDPGTESVSLAPHPTPLRLRSLLGFGSSDLYQQPLPPATVVKIANPTGTDLGQHRHFLRYELNGISDTIVGAYGFFARLTSPSYTSSEPILVILNSQLGAAELLQAALDINYVAGAGDFDGDDDHDCADVNALVANIVGQTHHPLYDLNGDGLVNVQDLSIWRARAGAARLPSGNPYLPGDANLDGVVDGSDFGVWNAHKFTTTAAWCSGDFNADGVVDGSDFGIWNANKFQASDGSSVLLPEASVSSLCLIVGLGCLGLRTKPHRHRSIV